MVQFTCCCLLVVVIVTSLPAASLQLELPDIQSFLNYWGGAQSPVNEAKPSDRTRRDVDGNKQSRTKRASGDSSTFPHTVETSTLPMFPNNTINDRYMPVLGNGYIATSVYSKFIYVNGLFNGEGADSHRAQVPAVIITRVTLPDELEKSTIRRYTFNIEEGVFIEHIDCPYAYITHRTYIHHKYIRLLVTDIKVTRKDIDGATFELKYPQLDLSDDIQFEQPQQYRGHKKVSGRTKTAERGASVASVHSFYFTQVKSISVVTYKEQHAIMIQSVDIMENDAQGDFDKAKDIIAAGTGTVGIERLYKEHTDTIKLMWDKGKIETFGDLQLSKTVLFSQYYLLTSMPPQNPSKPPSYQQVYHGISRNSLARGSKDMDYRGHIFWDNEMYIMPAVLLFHPQIAKNILRIRSSASTAAREYAQQNGHQGYQFPWESGLTGHDVTPSSCPDCRDNAVHITGAVGWSIRQYFSATRDKAYMVEQEYNGCDMTREIARFFATLAVYNNSEGRYDINNVTGPDDWHPRVNNNAYTNVMASLAIHWARYFACMCGRNERDEVPDEWMAVADFLELPFDNVRRTHHQFQGYDKLPQSNRTIKQADTILLTYPVNWNMSRDIMRNDLQLYEDAIRDGTPAMTFSFMSVGYKWGDDPSKMDSYFQKGYEDYVIQPFKIWTEYSESTIADQEKSSVNYLPGAGGFLQSLIYGYAGIRVRPEFLEFHNPTPPVRCDSMLFSSFDYLGTDMTIEIHRDRVKITINEVGDYKLILKRNATTMIDEPLTVGAIVTIDNPKDGFYILTTDPSACEHPRDFIYMPWGYSPWISSSPHVTSSVTLVLGLLSCAVLLLTAK